MGTSASCCCESPDAAGQTDKQSFQVTHTKELGGPPKSLDGWGDGQAADHDSAPDALNMVHVISLPLLQPHRGIFILFHSPG